MGSKVMLEEKGSRDVGHVTNGEKTADQGNKRTTQGRISFFLLITTSGHSSSRYIIKKFNVFSFV